MITKVDRKYLEINSPDEINSSGPKTNCKIEIKNPPDFQINKFFYKQIGKSYRWIDRLAWNDAKWMAYTNNSNLETYILRENDDLIGFFDKLISSIELISKYFLSTLVITKPFFQLFHHQTNENVDVGLLDHHSH